MNAPFFPPLTHPESAERSNTDPCVFGPLADSGLDPFEEGLLPLLRHLICACRVPQSQSWHRAFVIAGESMGEVQGLAVAHGLWPLVQAVHRHRGRGFQCHDPLDIDRRTLLTRDEEHLLRALHHMRRDQTPAARDAVEDLCGGQMDPDVIRAGLSFAHRFPSGARARLRAGPGLRLVG